MISEQEKIQKIITNLQKNADKFQTGEKQPFVHRQFLFFNPGLKSILIIVATIVIIGAFIFLFYLNGRNMNLTTQESQFLSNDKHTPMQYDTILFSR